MKRLFWDIETSPNIGLFWQSGYKLNIPHENIIKERAVICIGYKWEGERKSHVLRWDSNQCDKSMLRQFVAITDEADELVHHYGDHFDMPWIRTRILFHRLPPIPIFKTVDTKGLASKYFYFNSNKLDYISSFLGHGKKLHTDFDLWKKIVLQKDGKALDYMCRYCGIDVKRLESVYHDLKPFIPQKTHSGVLAGKNKWSCPRCESEKVKVSKTKVTAAGTVQKQMQCLKCGGFYSINYCTFESYKEAKAK